MNCKYILSFIFCDRNVLLCILDNIIEVVAVPNQTQINETQTNIPQSSKTLTPNTQHDLKIDSSISPHVNNTETLTIPNQTQTSQNLKSGNIFDFNIDNDPSTFSNIQGLSWEMKNHLVKSGLCQPLPDELPDGQYPKDKYGRHFQFQWYKKILPDGSVICRDWLTYSIKTDRVFCLDCILFTEGGNPAWTKVGFHTWVHGSNKIIAHETSSNHVQASVTRKIQQTNLPLIPSLTSKKKEQVFMNIEVVKQLIDITVFLGKHNLAFRGHRENVINKMCGNFKDLALLLSKYSPHMASYFTQIKSSRFSYLSWRRQNSLIEAVSSCITHTIQNSVRNARLFSISIDSTFDVSRKEQISFVIRYINENEYQCKVEERLLALKESSSTQGYDLANLFYEVCAKHQIDWKKYLVGQSYDGASNMRGQYNGLQAIIRNENPQAMYVWCYSHRLNLVVTDAVCCNINAMDLFGNIEKVFDFICTSKKRVALFEDKQKSIYEKKRIRRVKRVTTTRWMSHKYALDVILEKFDALIETLEKIRGQEGQNDRRAGSDAGGLLFYFSTKRFLQTAFLFKSIFDIIEPTSLILQSPDMDILAAVLVIEKNIQQISELRSDESFEEFLRQTDHFEKSLKNIQVFNDDMKRIRKKKKMPGESMTDDPLTDPTKLFKTETFYTAIDCTVTQLKERFLGNSKTKQNQTMGLLKDISLLSIKRMKEIQYKPTSLPEDAFTVFSDIYKSFVDKDSVCKEYIHFCSIFEQLEQTNNLPLILHSQEKVATNLAEEHNSSSESVESDESDIEDPLTLDTKFSSDHKIKEKNCASLLPVFK